MTTGELILAARLWAAEGEQGFDTDEQLDEWMARGDELGATIAEKAVARRHAEAALRERARGLQSTATEILNRASRLTADADRIDAGTLSLLEAHVEAGGEVKIATPDGSWVKLAIRKSEAVEVQDEAALPESLWRVKREPDKTAIKAALASGPVAGAVLVTRESRGIAWGK